MHDVVAELLHALPALSLPVLFSHALRHLNTPPVLRFYAGVLPLTQPSAFSLTADPRTVNLGGADHTTGLLQPRIAIGNRRSSGVRLVRGDLLNGSGCT